MTSHSIQLTRGSVTYIREVHTQNCSDVESFIREIKRYFSPELDTCASRYLILCQPDETTEIPPLTPVSDLHEVPGKPMVVIVDIMSIQHASRRFGNQYASTNRFVASVTGNARTGDLLDKELDRIAERFSQFYNFARGHQLKFRYVLSAYLRDEWEHRVVFSAEQEAGESGSTPVTPRIPRVSIALRDMLTEGDWLQLKRWYDDPDVDLRRETISAFGDHLWREIWDRLFELENE